MAVASLGEGRKLTYFWLKSLTYIFVSLLAGALFGLVISLMVHVGAFLVPDHVQGILFSVILGVYLLKSVGIVQVPHPQRKWQVPPSWVDRSPFLNMTIWGSILGAGVFTYIPYVSFWLMYVYIGLFLTPFVGFWLGLLFGFVRAFSSVMYAAKLKSTRDHDHVFKHLFGKQKAFEFYHLIGLTSLLIYVLAPPL
ncbi:hypothetical protein CR194_05555 [Salipaludibacillus keqinensis]|uniref:Uncharacterized protein n=1 Tax=Salipaludibacillus keqinensis TaxID=2045207 RepID=A0A323TIM8_9BACI|nr:hypothetical protein CR194_05555 [Salipaludibacillus keqinensis]